MYRFLHKRPYSPICFGDHLEREPSDNMQFDLQDSFLHSNQPQSHKTYEKMDYETNKGKVTTKLEEKIMFIPIDQMEKNFSSDNRNFSQSLMDVDAPQNLEFFINKSEESQHDFSMNRNEKFEMQSENSNQLSPRQGVLTRDYNKGNPKKDDYEKNIPNHVANKIIGLAQQGKFDHILERICTNHLIEVADLKLFLRDKKNKYYGLQKLQCLFTVVNGVNKAEIEAFHQFFILALRRNYVSLKLSEKSKISNLKDYIRYKNKTLLWIKILHTDDKMLST